MKTPNSGWTSATILKVISVFCFSAVAFGQTSPTDPQTGNTKQEEDKTKSATSTAAPSENKRGPKVLDFDAEVIEGERKTPDLFVQMQPGSASLDAIIFQRSNFNDFHDLEKRQRPLYRKYSK